VKSFNEFATLEILRDVKQLDQHYPILYNLDMICDAKVLRTLKSHSSWERILKISPNGRLFSSKAMISNVCGRQLFLSRNQ